MSRSGCRAPEQTDAEFGSRGTHTDVWGFAATVLHLASGQLPYKGLTPYQIMGAMMRQRPPAVIDALPSWLHQILQQCFSFDVAARPSVLQLLQASLAFPIWHTFFLCCTEACNICAVCN